MKSLLDQVSELDRLIRQLHKLASRMKEGQIVDAHRECHSLIGSLQKNRADLITSSEESASGESASGEKDDK